MRRQAPRLLLRVPERTAAAQPSVGAEICGVLIAPLLTSGEGSRCIRAFHRHSGRCQGLDMRVRRMHDALVAVSGPHGAVAAVARIA
jgi:hypothetical protein